MIRLVKHKYKAIPVEIEGIRFASKKEGRYFQQLRIREKSGEIVFFFKASAHPFTRKCALRHRLFGIPC